MAIIATAAVLVEKQPEVAAFVVYTIVMVFAFWLASEAFHPLSTAYIDPWWSRKMAAYGVAWLDSDKAKLGFRRLPALPAGTTMQRLYEEEPTSLARNDGRRRSASARWT